MSFYVTGGTLESDARSYVEREADRQLYDGLLKAEFCYVLTARQMGKSSLMVRTADRLQAAGIHVAALDLTALGAQNLTPEQWYYGLLDTLGLELGLQTELEKFWHDNPDFGPLHCFMKSIRQVALPRLQELGDPREPRLGTTSTVASGPLPRPDSQGAAPTDRTTRTKIRLVIFVDEIDFVRSLPFSTDEFFAAIRECYNHRTIDSAYETLTFCLLGVASPSDLIRDTRTTPFNIGRRIELNDFTPEEAAALAQGLQEAGIEWQSAKQLLERVFHWTNGHPYLTQRLCLATTEKLRTEKAAGLSAIDSSPRVVDRLCDDLYFSARARELDDNLIFVRERLLRSEVDVAGLLELYRSVRRGNRVMDDPRDPLIRLLNLTGIVRVTQGQLRERNRIYARVFDDEWARSNLPRAELRRQREAYFRGIIRATAVTGGVFLIMTVLIAIAVRARHDAREALWKSLYRQARLNRASALPGQRFDALDSIRQASKIKSTSELTDEAIACLAMLDLRQQFTRNVPEKLATALVFSEDLELYASGDSTGEIVVRRAADDEESGRWKTGLGAPERIWISPDKRYLSTASRAESATILSFWRCPTGEKLFSLTNQMQPEAFDFHPESKEIAVGGTDGFVRILSLPGGGDPTEFEAGESCSVLRYDPEGRRLAVGSSNSLKVGIYDVATGTAVTSLHSSSPPRHLAWHPDGQTLAAGCEDRLIRLWVTEADEFPKEELPRQPGDITALAFNRLGNILASASSDQRVSIWNGAHGQPPLTVADSGNVRQLQFDAHDHRLGLVGTGGIFRFMKMASTEVCRTLSEFDSEELNGLDIHPNGRLLASAHSGGISFWDLTTSRKLGRMAAGTTVAARFHPLSGDMIDADFRGTYCFAVEPQEKVGGTILALKPKQDFYLGPGAFAVDFAAEADVLAVAYEDRVRLVRSTNSAYGVIEELIGQPGFKTVALSPDGRRVATGNWTTGDVWVWERSAGSKPRTLRVGGRARVRFSPDGRWLATGTERKITLWDTRSWESAREIGRLSASTQPAPIAFGKGGLWATAWSDTIVCLLDPAGKTIANLEPPDKNPLADLTFDADGSRLACATSRSILVWDLNAVAHGLTQLGLSSPLKASANSPPGKSRLTLEIGALDRLRFSQAKNFLGLRREVGELTVLIAKSPETPHYYRHRAERYKQLGEFAHAIADYRRWIELDEVAGKSSREVDRSWPLRDLALIYLYGPPEVQNYAEAFELTQRAIDIDPENPANHFQHGIAGYRLGQYETASTHLETSRRTWEKQKKDKDVAVALFYEAMCFAHKKDMRIASSLLEQAKQVYARTDLEDRKSLMDQFPDLLWEAERVVGAAGAGG